MLEPLLWSITVISCYYLLIRFLFPYGYVPFRSSVTDNIPGPKGYPVVGNLFIFLTTTNAGLLPFARKLRKDYGPIFRLYGLGKCDILVNDLDGIEKILSSARYLKKSSDYGFIMPWLREGLLTSTSRKWHSRRKLLTPTFHFKILDDYLSVFNKNTDIFIQKIQQHLDEDFIRINDFTSLLTLDVISETAMGVTINAQAGKEEDYVKAVHRMSEIFQLRQLTIRLHRDIVYRFSSLGREEARLLKTLHGFTQKIIRERRAEYRARKNNPSNTEERANKRRLAFLDQLIELSEGGEKLSDLDIQEEVDTFMFEGHDTTSAAISWAIYLLGSHPDIQDRAVDELTDIFGGSDRAPTCEDLNKMKYLEQVIKETLRMYPSVPGFGRELESEVEILGYRIPAGVNVVIVPVLLQHDPELYPEPEKFDPDRFSLEACQKRHPYAFIPFSAGPRSCIGQRFALMEEKVVLSAVLRNFKIESLDQPEDITPLLELIMRPKDPLRIRFTPR